MRHLLHWWSMLPWSEALFLLIAVSIAVSLCVGGVIRIMGHDEPRGATPNGDHRSALYIDRRRHRPRWHW